MEPSLGLWLGSLLISLASIGAWAAGILLSSRKTKRLPAQNGASQVGGDAYLPVTAPDCHMAIQGAGQARKGNGVCIPAGAKPLTLEWQGIGCSYEVKGTAKVVLTDIWGSAQPGQMQALMGPSGAGKSTLMDMLALRKSVGNLTGRLLVNGKPASSAFVKHTSYVPQEDTFIPTMTCEETLRFYSAVTLPGHWSRAQIKQRVTEVLTAVGLSKTASTLVGGTLPGGLNLRGLSGGERRRLSIAAGILSAPSVLFLDEPTTGLDSFAALNVVGHLKRVAEAAKQTVISTIHQPRAAIWEMFDSVTLLSGGHLLYHGACQDMVAWFGSIGYLHVKGSESDWVLDLVATGFDKPADSFGHTMRTQDDLSRAAAEFKAHYLQGHSNDVDSSSDQKKALGLPRTASSKSTLSQLTARVTSIISTGHLNSLSDTSSFPAGWWRQFAALYARELASITRNPADVIGRQLTFTVMALLFGLTWYMLNLGTLESLQSRTNMLFMNNIVLAFMPFITLTLYTDNKRMYLADASAKLYRASAFYMAKVLAVVPFHVFSIVTYGGIMYGLGGLRHGAEAFARFSCVSVLLFLIAVQVMHLCTIITPNFDTSFALALVWATPQIMCGSYLVRYSQASLKWLTQLRWVTATYYALDALVQNELSGSLLDCSQGFDPEMVNMLQDGLVNSTPTQRSVFAQMSRPRPGCVFAADSYVRMMGYSRRFSVNVGCLVAYLIVLNVLTYLALLIAARKERR